MDFLLVPDALTASEIRYALATRNTMGAKVGSFSVLLETLAELWLIEPSERDWSVALQEEALAMVDAFWAKSIRVDEPATVGELTSSLQFFLNHMPLGSQLKKISAPANRNQHYYNDLAELARRISERPAPDQLAEQWFAEHNELCIEPVYVYPLCAQENLYPWQRQILDLLKSKGWLAPEPDKYTFIPTPVPASENSPIQQFASTLFHPKKSIIELENLYWLTCRDHLQEVEAVTSMVQAAVEQGTKPEKIAVVVPKGGDYELWLEKHFEYAGLIASNLRPESGVFDWQSSLIHDLLTSLVQPDIPMAMMSAIINPLMPWGSGLGHKLAERFGNGDKLTLGNEPSQEEEAMLRLLQNQPEENSAAVLDWLKKITDNTQSPRMKGLGKKRMRTLLSNTRRLMGLYDGQSFTDQISNVIRQTPVTTLESQEDRIRYLHAINIIREGEPLPFQVEELFVLGFNQGHYSYQAEHTGPINRDGWDQLAVDAQLAIPTVEESQKLWEEQFAELMRRADRRITFLRSLNDHQGASLEPSETLLDMALCFQPLEKLDPEQLEQPVFQAEHSLLRKTSVTLEQPVPSELKDLELAPELIQQARLNQDGTPKPESPSSLEKLMQSPLAWLLYRLGIKSRQWEPQTPDISVQGTIAHKVFELFYTYQSEAWSEALFDSLFNQAVQEEAAFLDSPQWRLKRNRLRNSVYRALNDFATWCQRENWTISNVELELQGQLWNTRLKGFVDAVLTNDNQTLIVDYKTSKHGSRLKRLEKGYELQTLIYRELYLQQNKGSEVMSGYYTLNDTTLLTDQHLKPSDQLNVLQPEPDLVAQSAEAVTLVRERLKNLQSGTIKLNERTDEKAWKDRGITPYALADNPVISRFTRNGEGNA
ncbi:PD-(D/E)XK nuclease family protein [Marinobacter persicus]|uniref:PD-(D/E)XK nuclease superfamily protein n=1 Tax=Marinobacter persicus TaxID=930118 RepID=A0A2S6G2Q1_9GAMM|nr:PD-(D/E)XK nuclease family protein [Marinobacter persicus]PPK50055.1 PD-(D/E)XK nuclease superfamily protein [Marinobacter persicus]PPK52241.1 PD-(D/E)XK nuclease superfamily protein [Marinobacter persicus]PPK56632.1 PD-(D/E)XK nuclease superfamily protein [Marinobacter persicus]